MKYVPPYGRETEGDAAHYINGNPKEGIEGSIPPANAFEHPLREIVGVIQKSEFTPDEANLLQLAIAVRSQRLNWVEDTGSMNVLSVACDPPINAYTKGLTLHVKVKVTNDGTVAASIDAGPGRVPIIKMDGNSPAAGDLRQNGVCELVYDGTKFQLTNFIGTSGTGPVTNNIIKIPYAVDSDPLPNVIKGSFVPTAPTLSQGDCFYIKVVGTVTGNATLQIDSQPAKQCVPNGGGPMLQGDIHDSDIVLFVYDGTVFKFVPTGTIDADVTLTVPSQYATVPLALTALKRKTIAQTAMVTIQIASTTIQPFTINHPNSDRITIRGTKLASGPDHSSFTKTVPTTPSSRIQDSNLNLAMLRGKYGTELQVPAGQVGIWNTGPGEPIIADLLITGPNFAGSSGGQSTGLRCDLARNIRCYGVSCWGLDFGYFGAGNFYCFNSYCCACFQGGWFLTGPGGGAINACGSYGNAVTGFFCNQHAVITAVNSQATCNGYYGLYSGEHSELSWQSSDAIANGVIDVYANNVSAIICTAANVGSCSPLANTDGNHSSTIVG